MLKLMSKVAHLNSAYHISIGMTCSHTQDFASFSVREKP